MGKGGYPLLVVILGYHENQHLDSAVIFRTWQQQFASVVNNARLINWTEVLKSVPDAGCLIARDYVELKKRFLMKKIMVYRYLRTMDCQWKLEGVQDNERCAHNF